MKAQSCMIQTRPKMPKRSKKTERKLESANIAERYLELRRLRERLSEAEAYRGSR